MMRYEVLGSSRLRVSELALGTMAFGEPWGWGGGRDECRRILDAYREARDHFIDAADEYVDGSAEHQLGELPGDARADVMFAARYTQRTSSFVLGDGATRIDYHRADRSRLLLSARTPIPAGAR